MSGYYIDKRLCPCCLGARRLGGEPCEECGGTGVAKDAPVLAQRSAPVGGETLPHLGDPFPEPSK